MNTGKKIRWLAVWFVLTLGLVLGIDSALAQATVPSEQGEQVRQPSADTSANYETLKEWERHWESALRAGGWVRHSYHQRMVGDDQSFRSPDAQLPSEATIEIWFHFNTSGLADQQITFIDQGSQRRMTEIQYRGIYRGLAANFAPLEEKPYSPSLYFYLIRATPAEVAQEGVQMEINREIGLPGENTIARFTIKYIFPAGMPGYTEKDPDIIGSAHTISIDPVTAQPLQIENFFLLKDGGWRLFQEITYIEAERVASLPEDVQWYFDRYDQLDWSSYIK